jgi:hypothetical protein
MVHCFCFFFFRFLCVLCVSKCAKFFRSNPAFISFQQTHTHLYRLDHRKIDVSRICCIHLLLRRCALSSIVIVVAVPVFDFSILVCSS